MCFFFVSLFVLCCVRNLHAMKNVGRYNFNYSSACHFLRGSCLLLGAKRTELCQQLDELAQSSRPESSVIMFFFFSLLIFFIIIVIISMMNQVLYCQSFYGKSCVGKYNSAKAAAESNRVDKQQEVFAYVEYKSQWNRMCAKGSRLFLEYYEQLWWWANSHLMRFVHRIYVIIHSCPEPWKGFSTPSFARR